MPVGQGRSSGETPGTLAAREQARQRRVDAGTITAATAKRQREADLREMAGRAAESTRERRAAEEAERPAREAAERKAARERAEQVAQQRAADDARTAAQRERTAAQQREQRAPAEQAFAEQVARGELGAQRRPWSSISPDFRGGRGNDRTVMVAGPNGSTMVPWYGPEGARGSRTPPGLAPATPSPVAATARRLASEASSDAPEQTPAQRLAQRSDAELDRMATNLRRRAEGSGDQADARRRLADVETEIAKRRDPSRIIRGIEAGLQAEREGYTREPTDDEVDNDASALTGPARRMGPATERLQAAVPRMTADQAETVLARAREAGLDADHPLVVNALDRLEATGGKRRGNAARKWFGATGDAEERRADRQASGTGKQQRQAYAEYVQDLAREIEDANRGGDAVRRRPGDRGQVPSIGAVLTSSPDTMRARLSPESLERLAALGGPPLSFDAWRYQYQGARDRRAVESYQRRTAGYFSEYG